VASDEKKEKDLLAKETKEKQEIEDAAHQLLE